MRPLDHLRSALADRYTVERELGQGGMATVYLASDRKHDRPVAIKVLRPPRRSATPTSSRSTTPALPTPDPTASSFM